MNANQSTFVAALALGLAVWLSTAGSAHDQIPGRPQQQPILIRGATVHPVDGATLTEASVLFEEGRIGAVGKNIDPPPSTQVIEAEGQHVYPGLIEPLSDLGLREINAVDATVDTTEYGQDNPNARAWVAVNPDSELIPVTRAGGVLLANVAPQGRYLRGQSAVMQLDGWTASEMILRAPSGLSVAWESIQPRDSDDKALAKKREEKFRELDDLLDQVRRYRDRRRSTSQEVPSDIRLESLIPVVEGELPLIAEANRQPAIEAAVAYAQSQGLNLVIFGGYDAEACADLLVQHQVPVILAGIHRLPQRRDDPYDAPYTLPERLRQAGVRFAIGGDGPGGPGGAANARNLPYHAATAVAYGLPRDQAIRAITLAAAEILGIDDQVGSINVGKHATLIVTDGDVLESESNVTHAWIQGREVDLRSKHTMLYEKYKQKYRAENE